jgi:endonuclease/exonuclease/phosphatase family metal-dependent hydrolase
VPPRLTIVAFNAERLKFRPATRALIDRVGAQVALLSEVDVGMARSGNTHTVRDLVGRSQEGWLFGVEYVELDLGDRHEMRDHAGERNAKGFHGNAIVTRLALADPHLIPLEESGSWFPGREGMQRRIGGRMALAARVAEAARPFWVVSTHLESKTDPQDRAAQMRVLLRALDAIAPGAAMVIGGDLNTKALPADPSEQARALAEPERWEPLFADLRAAGFNWAASNLAKPTQRTGPSGDPDPPFRKLDWILTRGVTAENPRVVPARDSEGHPISDHEMLAVDVVL